MKHPHRTGSAASCHPQPEQLAFLHQFTFVFTDLGVFNQGNTLTQIKPSSNDCYNILGTNRFLFVYSFALSQAGRAAPFPQHRFRWQRTSHFLSHPNSSASALAASVLPLQHRASSQALAAPSFLPATTLCLGKRASIPPQHSTAHEAEAGKCGTR